MLRTESAVVRYRNNPDEEPTFAAEMDADGPLVVVQFQTVEASGGFTIRRADLADFASFLASVVDDAGPWQDESRAEPAPETLEEATNG